MKIFFSFIGVIVCVVAINPFGLVFAAQERIVLGNTQDQYWIWVDEKGDIKQDSEAFAKGKKRSFSIDDTQQGAPTNTGGSLGDKKTQEIEKISVIPVLERAGEEETEENFSEAQKVRSELVSVSPAQSPVTIFTRQWYDENDDLVGTEKQSYIISQADDLVAYSKEDFTPKEVLFFRELYVFETEEDQQKDLVKTYTSTIFDDHGEEALKDHYEYTYDGSGDTAAIIKTVSTGETIEKIIEESYQRSSSGNIDTVIRLEKNEDGDQITAGEYEYKYTGEEKIVSKITQVSRIDGEKTIGRSTGEEPSQDNNSYAGVLEKITYSAAEDSQTAIIEKNIFDAEKKNIEQQQYIFIAQEEDEKVITKSQKKKIDTDGNITASLESEYIYLADGVLSNKKTKFVNANTQITVLEDEKYTIDPQGKKQVLEKKYTITDASKKNNEEANAQKKTISYTDTIIYTDNNTVQEVVRKWEDIDGKILKTENFAADDIRSTKCSVR